ncbi:MAG: hypothetical protein MJA29_06220 [Candidatus Omnitrophica bacterium]|nr:hypothetical protein [Candidatus Omnitrophota bacterium]
MKDKRHGYLRYIARIGLLLLSVFWFIFALLSGAERYGGGIRGIIRNLPNTLPWLLPFILVYVVFKWEIIGGALILFTGIFSIWFFEAYRSPVVLFAVSIPLIILGSLLMLSWYIDKMRDYRIRRG